MKFTIQSIVSSKFIWIFKSIRSVFYLLLKGHFLRHIPKYFFKTEVIQRLAFVCYALHADRQINVIFANKAYKMRNFFLIALTVMFHWITTKSTGEIY